MYGIWRNGALNHPLCHHIGCFFAYFIQGVLGVCKRCIGVGFKLSTLSWGDKVTTYGDQSR